MPKNGISKERDQENKEKLKKGRINVKSRLNAPSRRLTCGVNEDI
jgi:hypothetical protein